MILISKCRSFKHIHFNIGTDIQSWVREIDTFYYFRTRLVVFSSLGIINEILLSEMCIFFIFIKCKVGPMSEVVIAIKAKVLMVN